jgi:hypothetical protein
VVLHKVRFSEILPDCPTVKWLYMVTTPDISRRQAIAVYLRRYGIEHDIRDVKVTLNTERIHVHTREMFEKELLTSLVAYNLVIQFRREAAIKADVAPRRLNFTGVWNTMQSFLLRRSPSTTAEQWEARYERALEIASKEILRLRPHRSYPPTSSPMQTQNHSVSEKPTQKTHSIIKHYTTLGPLGVGSHAVSLKKTINVLNDAGEDDSLSGGTDTDWFFRRALDDVITDLFAGETIDLL